MDATLIGIGSLTGFFVGLTGMGGGALMLPLLVFVAGVEPVLAVGTDLVIAAITKSVGAWTHYRHGTVNLRLVYYLAWGSVPASLAGGWTLQHLRAVDASLAEGLLLRVVGILLISTPALALVRYLLQRRNRKCHSHLPAQKVGFSAPAVVAIGAVGGFLVGMTSVGAGTLIMAFLFLRFGFTPAQMVGADLLHAVILTTAAGTFHWSVGNVDTSLILPLLLGSLPGVLLGSHLSVIMPNRVLRGTLGAVLFVAGLKLL